MPFKHVSQIVGLDDYKKGIKQDLAKVTESGSPFHYLDKFEFTDKHGKPVKGALLLVGTVPSGLLSEVKTHGSGYAHGTCALTDKNEFVLNVEKGTVDEGKATRTIGPILSGKVVRVAAPKASAKDGGLDSDKSNGQAPLEPELKQAALARRAAEELRKDVEALLLRADEEIKQKPQEAVSIAKTAKGQMDELAGTFQRTFPKSELYPGDAVERGREHLDKSAKEVEKRTGELQKSLVDFKNRLSRLMDGIKEVVSTGGPGGAQVKRKMSEASVLANGKDYAAANERLDEVEALVNEARDAHGNARALVEKEDALVKRAISELPPEAQQFQKAKFGGRLKAILGESLADVSWESMIGTKSTPIDVISQRDVFDATKVDKEHKLNYLDFQNSMYPDEAESRAKMVIAFYEKKKTTLADGPELKELEEAYAALQLSVAKNPKQPDRAVVNRAYKAMGMRGLSDPVVAKRDEIKKRLFLAKTDDEIDRGRVGRTEADVVLGFAVKALKALTATGDKENAQKLAALIAEVKQLNQKVVDDQRQLTGYAQVRDKPSELTDKLKKDTDALNARSKVAARMMAGLHIGLHLDPMVDRVVEDWDKGGGIGANEADQEREVYRAGPEVTMGKNMNMRDDSTAASNIFRELGIPFTGGASGSTVDAVGGIVDALEKKEGEDGTEELEEADPRLGTAEAETCMYILGMHSAGHHSLVEMLYAAKQYPQKLFRNLRDPITDYINYQEKVKKFLEEHPATKEIEDNQTDPERRKQLAAGRHEDMVKSCPEDIISHDACTKALMDYAKNVVAKAAK